MKPVWELLGRYRQRDQYEVTGELPYMLDTENDEPAAVQFDHGYQHGGGWRPFQGFERVGEENIKYPGDPEITPVAKTKLRDEAIFLYPNAWVMIVQPDGTFEIGRMD